MKTILSFIFVLACACNAFAQGNLQFNQVRNITFSCSSIYLTSGQVSMAYDSLNIVVPLGKVLKIESASIGVVAPHPYLGVNVPSSYDGALYLNDVTIFSSTFNVSGIASPNFPIWLPSGTYKLKSIAYRNNSLPNFTLKSFISAIEFNIIP